MTTKQISEVFKALDGVFYSAWTNYAEKLLTKCKEEEKSHRGFPPEFNKHHTSDTIGANDAARLFAVKRVAEYILSAKFPTGRDYLHMQASCFIAAGIADEFGDKVKAAWVAFDISEIAELNYTEFVKTRSALVAATN